MVVDTKSNGPPPSPKTKVQILAESTKHEGVLS